MLLLFLLLVAVVIGLAACGSDNKKEKPQVLNYAIYVMNNVNDFAGETGFTPIPEKEAQSLIEDLEALQ